MYTDIVKLDNIVRKPSPHVNLNFVDGPFIEIKNFPESEYLVKMWSDDVLTFQTKISNNMWAKANKKYFSNWKVELVNTNGETVWNYNQDYLNKKVFISFESKSLGDTLAWFPYVEEFRKKHNCHVIVSTFRNDMFREIYPNLEFVEPGSVVNNLIALYRIGWYYNKDKEPVLPNTVPLQQTATNILGLDYREIHSPIYFVPKERPYSEKYVCIAPNSTAGCKLWNNPDGWVNLTKYLIQKGYKVVNISKDGDSIDGVHKIEDDSMENTKNVIFHSEFVIGLSSGLSWLSWALGKHVVMISNFTEPNHEFTTNCTRITNSLVCNGCWNNPNFTFDKGDWYWCPEHKNTSRHFECHKSITPEMVIEKIQHLF